jgi:predicted amidophosphoribosyltransferase
MSLLDLIVPPVCAVCKGTGSPVCVACLARLPLLTGAVCERCGSAAPDVPEGTVMRSCLECRDRRLGFERAQSALAYEGDTRALVHAFKDGGIRGLARHGAGLMVTVLDRREADVVTWVPPDRWREIRRGYHPPALLAAELGARWSLPARALLQQRGRRPAQRGLDLRARRANVRDSFRATGEVPRSVLLVDDVHTTGATLEACAHALRRAGATRVEAVSLARA